MTLRALAASLRASHGVALKRDITLPARKLPHTTRAAWLPDASRSILNGDDAAAIPEGDGYLLLAAEGMLPSFVAHDPWFAGFCSVMVNISDILAMGGRPYAVVDALFVGEPAHAEGVLMGMHAAAEHFGVPVVGGHTSRAPGTGTLLAVAILGRARALLSSRAARPGDVLIAALDLRGAYRDDAPFFDAATRARPEDVRAASRVLPELAEAGLAHAAKDVSMAGFAGTLTMFCESSGTGATLDLARLPRPRDVGLARWLVSFPSFGYLLATTPDKVDALVARFAAHGITCAACGAFDDSREVTLTLHDERAGFWDLSRESFTGYGPDSSEEA